MASVEKYPVSASQCSSLSRIPRSARSATAASIAAATPRRHLRRSCGSSLKLLSAGSELGCTPAKSFLGTVVWSLLGHRLCTQQRPVHRVVSMRHVLHRGFHHRHLASHGFELTLQKGNLSVTSSIRGRLKHLVERPHARCPNGHDGQQPHDHAANDLFPRQGHLLDAQGVGVESPSCPLHGSAKVVILSWNVCRTFTLQF